MAYRQAVCCVLLCLLQTLVPGTSGKFIERTSTEAEISLMSGEGCLACAKGCPNSNISFYLYTRDTQDSPYQLDPLNPDTITNANFVADVPLKVIIHGYTGNKDFTPNLELRPAYFEQGEFNIITVDWGILAQPPCYVESSENVYVVAECAAEFLDSLYTTRTDLDINNTHIIGHSLGAQIAGLMGNNLVTGKVPRVTGLDPAMPLFDDYSKSREQMINSDAAEFVDVYHSNAGFEGKKAACGTVDVYFNDGTSQPGCDCSSSCDHKRSVQYFAESVNSAVGLWGFACSDWDNFVNGSCGVLSTDDLAKLGESVSTSLSAGTYFTVTNSASPFLLAPSVYVEDSELAAKVDMSCTMTKYMLKMG